MNPMNRLPQSPRNIDAGLKLYLRNPSNAPASGAVASTSGTFGCIRPATNVVTVANSPTPEAKPSTPSMRLKALAHPMSQTSVIGQFNQLGVEYPATQVI